jgi:hypothetical protein
VYLARQAAGSSQITISPVSEGTRFPREPNVVVTRAGTAVVAWTESLGESEELMTTERAANGDFAPPRAVAGGEYMASLKVVASSQDVVLAGWIGAATGSPARQTTGRLRMTRLGEAGARFPITTTQQSVEGFALDADGRGGITAAFIGQRGRVEGGPLYAVAVGPDGQYGAARQLTARGERAVTASLATGTRGDAAAMWVTAGGRAVRFARRAR